MVEHTLGKGEVESSILSHSTIYSLDMTPSSLSMVRFQIGNSGFVRRRNMTLGRFPAPITGITTGPSAASTQSRGQPSQILNADNAKQNVQFHL